MILKNAMAALSLASLIVLTGAMIAQQQTTPSQDKQAQMKQKMQGKMMGGGMMGQMMSQMTARREEMSQLMEKVMASMAALRAEKDPAKLQAKLEEHADLLGQMRTMMMDQGSMMENMRNMMNSGNGKAAE